MKKVLFFSLLYLFPLHAMIDENGDIGVGSSKLQKIAQQSVRAPESLGKIDLLYDRENTMMLVSEDDNLSVVPRHSMDELLFNVIKQDRIDKSALSILLSKAYIKTTKLSDGTFKLQSYVRGPGGDLGTGLVFYWGTHVVLAAGFVVNIGVKTAMRGGAIPYEDLTDIGGKLVEIEKASVAMAALGTVLPTP